MRWDDKEEHGDGQVLIALENRQRVFADVVRDDLGRILHLDEYATPSRQRLTWPRSPPDGHDCPDPLADPPGRPAARDQHARPARYG